MTNTKCCVVITLSCVWRCVRVYLYTMHIKYCMTIKLLVILIALDSACPAFALACVWGMCVIAKADTEGKPYAWHGMCDV